MRAVFAAITAAAFLTGCKTLGPEPVSVPPLIVSTGEGAASFKLCRSGEVIDRLYLVTVSKIDSSSGMPMVSSALRDSRAQPVSFKNATFLKDGRACHMWRFAAEPGTYMISGLQERFRPGPAIDVIGLMTQAVIATSKKTDTVRFSDRSDRVEEGAPTFEIREGEVSSLGTITFDGSFVHFHVPVRDHTGFWDGQSTDVVQEPKLTVSYLPPVEGESDNGAPITGNVNRTTYQTLAPLVGREIVLEEPDMSKAVK